MRGKRCVKSLGGGGAIGGDWEKRKAMGGRSSYLLKGKIRQVSSWPKGRWQGRRVGLTIKQKGEKQKHDPV